MMSGFPFAPSYLKASVATTVTAKKAKRKDKNVVEPAPKRVANLRNDSITDKASTKVIEEYSNGENSLYSKVIRLSTNSSHFISGVGKLTLLKGSAVFFGNRLVPGNQVSFVSSCWQPALPLVVGTPNRVKQGKNKKVIEKLEENVKSIINEDQSEDCFILLEGIPLDDQEWLVSIEDQSMYQTIPLNITSQYLPPSGETNDGSNLAQTPKGASCCRAMSCALASEDHLTSVSIDVMTIPPSWQKHSEQLTVDLLEVHHDVQKPMKSVICGAKGVGKSSCLRYTINQLLALPECDGVCVIDCDLGQPEFGLSGSLSLHIIREPIFTPTHLHLLKPETSYFVGDYTTKNEPEMVIEIIRLLFARYEVLLQLEFAKTKAADDAVLEAEASSANIFDVLVSEQESKPTKIYFPLLVNTDGFIRYLGAEILSGIVGIVKPTHVLHLSTDKDSSLPAIEPLRRKNSGCKVLTLAPGRSTPSRISAVELRSLRTISYFLRGDDFMSKAVKKLLIQRRNQQNNTVLSCPFLPSDGATDKDNEQHCIVDDNISNALYIRSGKLVDSSGLIAFALMQLNCIRAPFDSVCVSVAAARDVPFHLILAALNASLVALIPLNDKDQYEHSSRTFQACVASESMPSSVLKMTNSQTATTNPPDVLKSVESSESFEHQSNVSLGRSIMEDNGDDQDYFEGDIAASPLYSQNDEQKLEQREEKSAEEVGLIDDSSVVGVNNGFDCRESTNLVLAEQSNVMPFSTFTLECSSCPPILPCIGLGIVRAIDLGAQALYLVPPCDFATWREEDALSSASSNKRPEKIMLVRGLLNIPTVLNYSSHAPCNAYASGEIKGEGSTVMKNRRIVKRKSQSQLN